MERDKTSSSTLANMVHHCLDGYVLTAKAFGADQSGKVERLAQDGVLLGLWARTIGLDSGNLDSQLDRFRPYIYDELCLLQRTLDSCLPRITRSSLAK
jgi:hypothetical protein